MYTTAFYISAYIGVVGADWIDDSTVAAEYDAHLVNGPSSKYEVTEKCSMNVQPRIFSIFKFRQYAR